MKGELISKNKLLMYLADLELLYSPGWGPSVCGDEKLYEFVRGLSGEIESWESDAVPCKECQFYTFKPHPNSKECYTQHCTRSCSVSTKPDDFCSYGRRRTDGI